MTAITAKDIGARLKALRGNRSLATVSAGTGLGVSALANYECGLRIPRDSAKITLARYYNQDVGALFFAHDFTISEVFGKEVIQ